MRTAEQKAAFATYMRERRKNWSEEDREQERQWKRAWVVRNIDKHRENKKRAAQKRRLIKMANPDLQRNANIKHAHGLTLVQYDAKLSFQNGLCRLCNKPFTETDGPALDHNHVTGQLRDFLHRTCNLAIGNLKDSADICKLAAEYLERHSRG